MNTDKNECTSLFLFLLSKRFFNYLWSFIPLSNWCFNSTVPPRLSPYILLLTTTVTCFCSNSNKSFLKPYPFFFSWFYFIQRYRGSVFLNFSCISSMFRIWSFNFILYVPTKLLFCIYSKFVTVRSTAPSRLTHFTFMSLKWLLNGSVIIIQSVTDSNIDMLFRETVSAHSENLLIWNSPIHSVH